MNEFEPVLDSTRDTLVEISEYLQTRVSEDEAGAKQFQFACQQISHLIDSHDEGRANTSGLRNALVHSVWQIRTEARFEDREITEEEVMLGSLSKFPSFGIDRP